MELGCSQGRCLALREWEPESGIRTQEGSRVSLKEELAARSFISLLVSNSPVGPGGGLSPALPSRSRRGTASVSGVLPGVWPLAAPVSASRGEAGQHEQEGRSSRRGSVCTRWSLRGRRHTGRGSDGWRVGLRSVGRGWGQRGCPPGPELGLCLTGTHCRAAVEVAWHSFRKVTEGERSVLTGHPDVWGAVGFRAKRRGLG